MRASRIAIAVLTLFALCIAPVALAETPSPNPAKVEPQATTHTTTSTATTATQESVADAPLPRGLFDFRAPDENDIQKTTGAYCTRAIDIDGVFCYIGCPEGCNCDVETFFSECCCEVQ